MGKGKKRNDLEQNNTYKQLKKIKFTQVENESFEESLLLRLRQEESFLDKKLQGKKENKNKFLFFRPAYGFAFVFIIILIAIFFLKFHFYKTSDVYIAMKEGNTYLNNSLIKESNQKLKNSSRIKTDKSAKMSIKIENNTIIDLDEKTEIMLGKITKQNQDVTSRIKLIKGGIFCLVKLPTKESSFEIKTDIADFSVKGTKFSINIPDDKTVKLDVIEGKVEVGNFIKDNHLFKKIKNEDVKHVINDISSINVFVGKSESIVIDDKIIRDFNNQLNELLLEALKIEQGNGSDLTAEISKMNEKFVSLHKEAVCLIKITGTEENKIEMKSDKLTYNVKKLESNPGISLTEKNTSITADNENIYISSDSNSAIYFINGNTGRVKWKFSDPSWKTIIGDAVSFQDQILFIALGNIVVLNKNGGLVSINKIDKGPDYWSTPIIIKNKLFFPSSQCIYSYEKNSFSIIDNLKGSMGQLFVSYHGNDLLCTDLNSKNIIVYDLTSSSTIRVFPKLKERSLMPPLAVNNLLFIADISGNIYKFSYYDPDKSSEIISGGAGIISKLIYNNNNLYFVANDGYFYKLDAGKFDKQNKITKIDNEPGTDKYLTKRLLLEDDVIYFCSDSGNLFCYNTLNDGYNFIKVSDKLVGSPVRLNDKIFVIDDKCNVYIIGRNNE